MQDKSKRVMDLQTECAALERKVSESEEARSSLQALLDSQKMVAWTSSPGFLLSVCLVLEFIMWIRET